MLVTGVQTCALPILPMFTSPQPPSSNVPTLMHHRRLADLYAKSNISGDARPTCSRPSVFLPPLARGTTPWHPRSEKLFRWFLVLVPYVSVLPPATHVCVVIEEVRAMAVLLTRLALKRVSSPWVTSASRSGRVLARHDNAARSACTGVSKAGVGGVT